MDTLMPLAPRPARLLMPSGAREAVTVVEGCTVRELLQQVPANLHGQLRVYNHGALVEDWDGFRLRCGDNVLIAVLPQGGGGGGRGKSIVGAILMIAVAVVAPWAGAAIASYAGLSAAAGYAIGIGITMVASLAISALIKPSTVNTGVGPAGGASNPRSYQLTGQSNAARPYGACTVVYGMHKVMPAMATNPDVDNWANSSTLSALYDFGLGYVNLRDIRIGDVPIENYGAQLVLHQNSYCDQLQLNPSRIGYDQYALVMKRNDPIVVRTKTDTICANLDMQFPRGIFQQTAQGGQLAFWADMVAYWRKAGDATWNSVPVDWFYGAATRGYIDPRQGIQWQLPGVAAWTDYYPGGTSTNELRLAASQYYAQQNHGAFGGNFNYKTYNESTPNPQVTWQYGGAWDEAAYFNRYPDIRQAGWSHSAQAHFESIGARENRWPGMAAQWFAPAWGWQPYSGADGSLAGTGTTLHGIDKNLYPYDGRVGGWAWIDSGMALLPVGEASIAAAPFEWRALDNWDPNVYLQRYPDVAAAGVDPWQHFIHNGAFEARDPYAQTLTLAVRLGACWVGPYWMRIFFQFPEPGEYELQVMRTDAIKDGTDSSIVSSSGGSITAQFNESTVALLRSYQWGLPVQPRLRHTMLEMRVQANDQLSGVVQNLSAIAISVLPVTSDGVNFSLAETRNPAWIALDILTSEKNPKPLARTQIDWPSWLHLAAICDTLRSWVVNGLPYTAPRYTCDVVVQDFTTVKDLVESVLSGCRASLVLTGAGTWGVLHDEEKSVPRQLLTPANSWGFSGTRVFSQQPHCLRVNFVNKDKGYVVDEVPVYWDGYDASNATIFETLETYGITDYAHAWAYGRFMLAQGLQRSELFSLSLDVENLLVQRGDLVHVAHDVPRVGGRPARVVQVQGADVQVDQDLASLPTGYSVRLSTTGAVRTGTVSAASAPDRVTLDDTTGIAPDDLIVLGEFDRVVQPYLVQRISPGDDLTAELQLCKYVPGVYQADQGLLPPWDAGLTPDTLNSTDLVSSNMTATAVPYYAEREPMVDVMLAWTTTGWSLDHHEVTVILPSGARTVLSDNNPPTSFEWSVDALRQKQYFEVTLQFEAVPVSSLGFRGVPAYATLVLQLDKTPPPPVLQFGVNVQKENVDLFWQPPDAPDIGYYEIRYTPITDAPDWNASQLLVTARWPANKSSAGARTGSYGIRVIDTSGNKSDVVWRRTTVALLPEINVITVVNDRDLYPERWAGVKDHVVVAGVEIQSEGDFGAVYPLGYYYCYQPVDLGDVYEVRVSSKIEAYGVTAGDFMSDWPLLSELQAMASAHTDLWDAWLEVRTANEMSVMADWVTMSSIDPIAGANDEDWSPWRPCQVGDFTARLLQFRIALRSKNPGVRVIVNSGRIEVDMPDRIDTYGDVQVPAAGLDFFFPVAFRALSAVAITIDGNAAPLVAKVTNKTAEGFHVQLFNTQTAAATAGQIDIMAEGYGRMRLDSI